MLSRTEGSIGVVGEGIGLGSTLEDVEDSGAGVLDAPRNRIWDSRRETECRMRASSTAGSTFLANKASVS
jgi:hypothetical protein